LAKVLVCESTLPPEQAVRPRATRIGSRRMERQLADGVAASQCGHAPQMPLAACGRACSVRPVRLSELQGKKVGICVSGGLDSKTVATRLTQAGVECICFTADLAQPDEDNIENDREKMRPTGAETVIVDLKHEMARACFRMIRTQA